MSHLWLRRMGLIRSVLIDLFPSLNVIAVTRFLNGVDPLTDLHYRYYKQIQI